MTIVLAIALTALLLFVAWIVGQLPTFWRRLAVVFALSWLGYGVVRLADLRAVSPVVQAGTAIALVGAGIAAALFLIQPLKWGLDDYFAALDGQMEAETTEAQP